MICAATVNRSGISMERLAIAVLGAFLAITLIVIGLGLYPGAEAIAANAADARIQGLVDQLDDARLTPARHLAQQHLEEAGPAAVDLLIAALHSSSVNLRRNSAEMLGYIGSPRALDALGRAMATDPSPEVRSRAAWALGELGDDGAVGLLERAAASDSSPEVRQEALDSLLALRSY